MNEQTKTKRPVKTAGYSFAKQRARRNARKSAAIARQAKYDALHITDKMNRAVLRPGASNRELMRVSAKLASTGVLTY